MNEPQQLLDLAVELARGAGQILRDGRANGFGDVDTKSSSVDVVTETDKASEKFIVERIRAQRPEDGIVGEEGASIDGSNNIKWHIDPLDGTVNFIYGIPNYCVSIGIEIDGTPAVGAVFNPETDEMFTAITGRGAFRNGKAIHVNTESDPNLSLVATGFSYIEERRKRDAELLLPVLPQVRDLRRMGSAALDLCSIACGRLDAYFERFVNSWDVVAGIVIAREAGAEVTGIGQDDWATDQTIIAANPQLRKNLEPLVIPD